MYAGLTCLSKTSQENEDKMAINPSYTMSWTILDRSSEIARAQVNAPASPIEGDVTAFEASFLDYLGTGTTVARNSTQSTKLANASIGTGNREDRWLVRYQDNTTLAVYNMQVPCRDNDLPTVAGTDLLDPAHAGYPAMKTAFEALALSPDGNAVTLLDVILIGSRR